MNRFASCFIINFYVCLSSEQHTPLYNPISRPVVTESTSCQLFDLSLCSSTWQGGCLFANCCFLVFMNADRGPLLHLWPIAFVPHWSSSDVTQCPWLQHGKRMQACRQLSMPLSICDLYVLRSCPLTTAVATPLKFMCSFEESRTFRKLARMCPST